MRSRILALLGLCAGLLPGLSPASAQIRFSLVNNTGQVIEQVYVSPSRSSNLGPDVLGANVLPAGSSSWIVPGFGDCVLDVRVVFQGGRSEERRQMNACSLSRIVWGGGGGGGDPSFQFVNQGGMTVNELYISLSSDQSWGRDRLGNGTLAPGNGFWVALPSGKVCTVDIRVVYADGRASERRGVETCSVQTVNFR
ncbi:Tat pathway signal protein [Siccirubricoccus phaeus]|uniref:Tat pathway signal protein n=1 Tax=Siccirubricoccus phaeus TaxID=2595053 RepID=UPI0011F21ECD|nr:Tat pathway signal protein [Siccirubricoccus phaeus]